MTALSLRVAALRTALADLHWIEAPQQVKRLSRDFYWFSPVLKRQLDDKLADAVVLPRDQDELRRLVAACVQADVPMTVRGAGTGNYGQAMPLQGGVVIDMTGFAQLLWTRDGLARAQAGIRLAALEELLTPSGWELRCMPSTYRLATLGGLFCGGFGGIGSVQNGPLSAPGNVIGIRFMTIEAEPRIIDLRGLQALPLAHTWGTIGILLELEIALAPAQHWNEFLLGFPDAAAAFAFGRALAQTPGVAKRDVAVFADTVQCHFTRLAEHLGAHEHVVITALTPAGREPLEQLLAVHGGRIAWTQSPEEAQRTRHTLLEYCWNHATLHALREDKSVTYLQTEYEPGREREQVEAIEREAPDEVLCHFEFIRSAQGRTVCVGLPLIRFTSEARLDELIALHRRHGVHVSNPHTCVLEEGKQAGRLPPGALDAMTAYDPHGLLNRGKVLSLADRQRPSPVSFPSITPT